MTDPSHALRLFPTGYVRVAKLKVTAQKETQRETQRETQSGNTETEKSGPRVRRLNFVLDQGIDKG
eukprot:COSAG03_NODE_11817_length_574_cov_1332.698947_1_plen_65_part_10